jgi:hypothetical protein
MQYKNLFSVDLLGGVTFSVALLANNLTKIPVRFQVTEQRS